MLTLQPLKSTLSTQTTFIFHESHILFTYTFITFNSICHTCSKNLLTAVSFLTELLGGCVISLRALGHRAAHTDSLLWLRRCSWCFTAAPTQQKLLRLQHTGWGHLTAFKTPCGQRYPAWRLQGCAPLSESALCGGLCSPKWVSWSIPQEWGKAWPVWPVSSLEKTVGRITGVKSWSSAVWRLMLCPEWGDRDWCCWKNLDLVRLINSECLEDLF